MKGNNSKSVGMLILFLVGGAAIGGIVGETLANSSMFSTVAPILAKPYLLLDLPPVTLDLHIFRLVFGLSLSPTLVSLLGVLAAYLLYRRL